MGEPSDEEREIAERLLKELPGQIDEAKTRKMIEDLSDRLTDEAARVRASVKQTGAIGMSQDCWTAFNHNMNGPKDVEGYATCSRCLCRENTDKSARPCERGPVMFHLVARLVRP